MLQSSYQPFGLALVSKMPQFFGDRIFTAAGKSEIAFSIQMVYSHDPETIAPETILSFNGTRPGRAEISRPVHNSFLSSLGKQ